MSEKELADLMEKALRDNYKIIGKEPTNIRQEAIYLARKVALWATIPPNEEVK